MHAKTSEGPNLTGSTREAGGGFLTGHGPVL
jgi:hypothetical protein